MSYKRKLRCIGEEIILGGTSYRLESVEGCGASAVVYRASYQDELSRGAFHYVFIKELYPWTADGSIFRTGSGEISYTPDGESRMELDRERFLLGNRVNLELLRQLPSGVSGNINSYEAFGTYYSVLAVHGGENLKTLLTDGHREFTLRESAVVIKQVLNALELFHKNHLLHLDISPDNILLLPEQALLIDYNSVWDTRDLRPEEFSFREKRGYSAPEISLKHVTEIGRAANIYSVCAVFFHMVMRRPLQEQEIIGNGLRRCFTRDLDAFRNVPESAAGKAVQILRKGLHMIPRKRWSFAAALREEIDELIRRIDGKGVSRSALWETSRRACGRMPGGKDSYLRQEIRLLDGEEIFPVQTECGKQSGFTVTPGKREISSNPSESGNSLPGTDSIEQLRSRLAAGEQILLTGPGGMGKTSLLYQIWRQETSSWRPREPVVLYVPLKDYQNCAGEPFFIRKTILRGLVFSEEQNGYQDAMHELDRVLGGDPGGSSGVILLLDGLNEAGERRENLLREIEGLGAGSGCGILLTDCTDEAKAYALHAFQRAVLLPLDPETVREQLERSGCLFPEAEELLRLLTNPMLLGLYQSVCAIRREIRETGDGSSGIHSPESNVPGVTATPTGDGPSGIHSAEELIGMFFTYLCKKQLRLDSGAPDRIADFQELMAYGLAQTDVYYVMQISEDVMAQLIQMDPDFPLDELTDLCGMPDEMAAVMQQAFEDLEDMLCEESARGEGDKRALVEAYNAYLDAYVQYAFYELDYVLLRMDPDHLAYVLNDESYTKIFQNWFQTIGVSDQDVDLVETALTVSGEALKDAQRKMTACGYSIDWD